MGIVESCPRVKSATFECESLHDLFNRLAGDYLMQLTDRITRVCEAVIKAKGGYFEESKI